MKQHRFHHQHFALDGNNNLVNIVKAQRDGGAYYCPYCKNQVMTKCGQIREWHFAHYPGADCDYYRYLHSLAQIEIRDWFNKTNEIDVFLDVPSFVQCTDIDDCPFVDKLKICSESTRSSEQRFNLKRWYTAASSNGHWEYKGHVFHADIMCPCKVPGKNPLFFNISVPEHGLSNDFKESGMKIIEIKIKSEQEIEDFINGKYKLSSLPWDEGKHVQLYNFEPKGETKKIQGKRSLSKFILFPDMRWRIEATDCKSFKERVKGSIYEVSFLEGKQRGTVSRLFLARAVGLGFDYFETQVNKWSIPYLQEKFLKDKNAGYIIDEWLSKTV